MKKPEHQENNPERPAALADATGYAPSRDEILNALDELHVVCECAVGEVAVWYRTDTFASEARRKAIEILCACHEAHNGKLSA